MPATVLKARQMMHSIVNHSKASYHLSTIDVADEDTLASVDFGNESVPGNKSVNC
jgi:hypothetical protein